jgi:hypothetical protein
MRQIRERLEQMKKDLENHTIYKEGLPGSALDIVNTLLNDLEQDEKENGWIPIEERLPETDDYILVSFSNFELPDIGRYETDKDGGGIFFPGDKERSYVSYGLFVNAWMPLPEPYKEV